MDEVATASQRVREGTDVAEVAFDPLGGSLESPSAARERANLVAGILELAKDVRADEAGGSGEEDAIAAQRVRPRGNRMVLTLLRSKKEIALKFSFIAIATIGLIFSSACSGAGSGGGGALAPSASAAAQTLAAPSAEADPTEAAAAAYCKQTGGQVEVRRPVYGSNGPSLLFLAGERRFCQYTAQTSGASRIHILLKTLYTTKPTLAALAYIAAPPLGSCNGNPASCYCTLLGGSDQFGGTTGAGGGWYKKNGIDQTLEACIFPDMSSIDSWGLAYHSDSIIRGIDLTKVMRYKGPGVRRKG